MSFARSDWGAQDVRLPNLEVLETSLHIEKPYPEDPSETPSSVVDLVAETAMGHMVPAFASAWKYTLRVLWICEDPLLQPSQYMKLFEQGFEALGRRLLGEDCALQRLREVEFEINVAVDEQEGLDIDLMPTLAVRGESKEILKGSRAKFQCRFRYMER